MRSCGSSVGMSAVLDPAFSMPDSDPATQPPVAVTASLAPRLTGRGSCHRLRCSNDKGLYDVTESPTPAYRPFVLDWPERGGARWIGGWRSSRAGRVASAAPWESIW